MIPRIILKRGKEISLLRKHPWVFSGAIQKSDTEEEGTWVALYSFDNKYLGSGFYSHGSSIAVRIFSFLNEIPDANFWSKKLATCFELRRKCNLISEENNMYRLVHGEGDGMPGLIIDIYNKTAVVQAHTAGVFMNMDAISAALQEVFKTNLDTIYCKSRASMHVDKPEYDYFLLGNNEETIAMENGQKFHINWVTGQKTGFFLDQRPNRKLLGDWVSQYKQVQESVSVLNTFSYSGGFSVFAMAEGANRVVSVDVSQTAIDLCNKNIELNFGSDARHTGIAEDVLKYLEHGDEKFDIVILDPPAFAKNMAKKHKAVMGYKRLNALGLKSVKPGGLLFTFSCSQVIDTSLFENTVVSAAHQAGIEAQILHRLGQGPDHPVNIYHPEGHYLKGLVLKIGD